MARKSFAVFDGDSHVVEMMSVALLELSSGDIVS
jgi:hypothetical protein